MFTNTEIDIDSIPKVEIVNLKTISKGYLKILYVNIFIQYIVLFTLLILAKNFIEKEWIDSAFWYAIVFLFLMLIMQFVFTILSFKRRGYALRTHDIIYAQGLLNYKRTTVPFIRIQHTETKQSFIAKKFNLASLHVYTAGESGGDLSINGLTLEEATSINELLTTKIN